MERGSEADSEISQSLAPSFSELNSGSLGKFLHSYLSGPDLTTPLQQWTKLHCRLRSMSYSIEYGSCSYLSIVLFPIQPCMVRVGVISCSGRWTR